MISVIVKTKDKEYSRIEVKGHAGLDDYGKDLLCCAVSVLTVNTANSLEQLTDSFISSSTNDNGYVEIVLKDHPHNDAVLLIESYLLGLNMLSRQYGKKYLRVEFKEV